MMHFQQQQQPFYGQVVLSVAPNPVRNWRILLDQIFVAFYEIWYKTVQMWELDWLKSESTLE